MSFFIIADDFGMSKSTNYAIIDGIKRGIISSTNIMINMPYVEEGKKILEMDIDCPLGIHWNLTAGQALSNSADIESLVDEKGYFYSREVFDEKIKPNSSSSFSSSFKTIYRDVWYSKVLEHASTHSYEFKIISAFCKNC